jgi:D-alanine-D-alanine ligase
VRGRYPSVLRALWYISAMDLKTKTIGVLMGGLSREREISLISGENCFRALESRGYRVVRIDALRDAPQRLRDNNVEVAFLALHGRYGEDGTIQGLLEVMGIPYTGSGVLASALGMNKISAKKIARSSGVPTPDFCEVDGNEPVAEAAARIQATLGLPVMIKPINEGSSLGIVKCKDGAELPEILEKVRSEFGSVFAERFVAGSEITVGVLCREGRLTALPVLELVPKREFYDYEAKYTAGLTDFILPARLDAIAHDRAQHLAISAFEAIGCRGFGRVDLIVDAAGTPWFVEVNTLPGMTELSDLPAQAAAAGISYEDLVEAILQTAIT